MKRVCAFRKKYDDSQAELVTAKEALQKQAAAGRVAEHPAASAEAAAVEACAAAQASAAASAKAREAARQAERRASGAEEQVQRIQSQLLDHATVEYITSAPESPADALDHAAVEHTNPAPEPPADALDHALLRLASPSSRSSRYHSNLPSVCCVEVRLANVMHAPAILHLVCML